MREYIEPDDLCTYGIKYVRYKILPRRSGDTHANGSVVLREMPRSISGRTRAGVDRNAPRVRHDQRHDQEGGTMNIKPCKECEHYYNPDGSRRDPPLRAPDDPCRNCAEGDNIFHDQVVKWTHYKRFWHAQLDSILASLRDDVTKRFSPHSRSYHMDRAASRIYRLELRVMKTGAWARMKAMVDIGTPTRSDPAPRVVKIHKLSGASATAGDYLEVDRDVANWAEKNLKPTILHEMVHYYLHDNGAYKGTRAADLRKGRNGGTDCHGRLFRECCKALGLQGHASEVLHKYQYRCECGWWIKSAKPIKTREQLRCGSCRKLMVTPTEYARLKKVAAIGSRSMPVKIEDYVPMNVKHLT